MTVRRTRIGADDGPGCTVFEIDSGEPGPTWTVLGGVHGDEPGGTRGAQLVLGAEPDLRRGRLWIVPVANEAAHRAHTRETPADGGNLARHFPGDPAGTETARLADLLATRLLADTDVLIDLHTATTRSDMAPLAGCVDDGAPAGRQSRALARTFGMPFVWVHPVGSPGRSVSVLRAAGRPSIYVESAGGDVYDEVTARRYRDGVLRCLAAADLLADGAVPRPATPYVEVGGDGDLDNATMPAPCAGLFRPGTAAGRKVGVGEPLGAILDERGEAAAVVDSPTDGYVMYLHRASRIAEAEPMALVVPRCDK